MGVRYGTAAQMGKHAAKVGPCRLSLQVSNHGFVTVVIDSKVHADSSMSNSDELASQAGHNGMDVDTVEPDAHPLLSLPGVKAAQDSWTCRKTYHLPTILHYSREQDAMIAWRKRMEPVRCEDSQCVYSCIWRVGCCQKPIHAFIQAKMERTRYGSSTENGRGGCKKAGRRSTTCC